jgi:hypothetical protein
MPARAVPVHPDVAEAGVLQEPHGIFFRLELELYMT